MFTLQRYRPGMEPGADPGQDDGRLGSVKARSAAVAARVSRRRAELESSRRLGLALLTWKRFGEIQGGDLAVLMTLSLFVAMVPLVLMAFSWISGFRPNANVATLVIRQYNLHGTEAEVVRNTFASANAGRSSATVLGLLGLFAAGFPAAVAVQKTFAHAWHAPRLTLVQSYLRGGGWFLIYIAVYLGVEAVRFEAGRSVFTTVLAIPIAVGLLLVMWMATPHLLLGKDLGGWRGLMPTALAGTVLTLVFRLAGSLLMPRWLASWAIPFGAVGVTLGFLTWVGVQMTGWVGVACFGAVYWERIASEDVVLAVEGEALPR
jgi:uncharacterized BrkB/YihY/UPF0761 family membrane protein